MRKMTNAWRHARSLLALAFVLSVLAIQRPTAQTTTTNRMLLTLQSIDPNGIPIVNRQIGPVSYVGTAGSCSVITIANAATPLSITLPITPTLQLYVRNVTNGFNLLTVQWTPQGGSNATVQTLGPGGVVLIWQQTTSTAQGITSLTFTGSLANTAVEYCLGG